MPVDGIWVPAHERSVAGRASALGARVVNDPNRTLSIGDRIRWWFFGGALVSSLLIIWLFSLQLDLSIVSFLVVLVSAGVAAGVSAIITRRLRADLNALMTAARRVSEGELNAPINMGDKKYRDETDELAGLFQEMQENLQQLVGQIQNTGTKITGAAHGLSATAEQMTTSTQEIAATMADISRGTDHQSRLVERTSSGMREVVNAVEQTERSAAESAERATKAVETVRGSSKLAEESVDKMREIFERVEDSSSLMSAFSDKLKQVNKIVVVISGIAQRTTLLSLNATIEAAKAGEYGRGFAVVADEIRKLAESTTRSAEQITELIEGVEGESRRVVEAMQASVDTVAGSRSDVTSIGDALQGIVGSFSEIQLQTQGIAELARTQAGQSQEILKAIEDIQNVADNTAAATMEISAATREQTNSMREMSNSALGLSDLAEQLKAAASRFRLEQGSTGSDNDTSAGAGVTPFRIQKQSDDEDEEQALVIEA